MNGRIVAICCVLYLVSITGAFGLGRYGAAKPTPAAEQVAEKHEDAVTHTVTTRTTVKSPQGEVKTTTTIDKTAVVSKDKKTDVVVAKRTTTNVSLLGGYDYRQPLTVQYGLAVTHEVFGPATVGIWGLNNGTLGVSLGVNF